jgi:hypothetical protein
MPAKGIQAHSRLKYKNSLDSGMRRNDGNAIDFQSIISKRLGVKPSVWQSNGA